jgi:(p)ppGpp synthase/HD superfamily hydrolase
VTAPVTSPAPFIPEGPALYPHFISGDPILIEAYTMAWEVHGGMVRKVGGEPYINHPLRVAARLQHASKDRNLIAAGFLHDAVEDTPTTIEDVRERMGDDIAYLVAALTENKSISDYEERKAEHRQRIAGLADVRVCALWCADKLINLRSLLYDYEVEGEFLELRFNGDLNQKLAHTAEDIEILENVPGVLSSPIFWDLTDIVKAIGRARDHD